MGRELRRVPLDFDWPLDEVWAGFVNPYCVQHTCAACNGEGDVPCARDCGADQICSECDGEGEIWPSAAAKRLYDEWQETPPPAGDGYQVWETVSEGSPVSPVFASPEELADWMVANDQSVTRGTTREQWLAFIRGPGWAPSMVSDAGGVRCGVQAVTTG